MFVQNFYILTLIFFITDSVLGEYETIKEISKKCAEEHHVPQEEIDKIKKNKIIDTDDENVHCYLTCFFKGIYLMDENGELTLENPDESFFKFKKYFPSCSNVTSTNSCDKAVNFSNCVWNQVRAHEEIHE